MTDTLAKAICFYLPQFHPIPENDDWWGRGFTEWRNVTKAGPLFRGHYQPHLPADLGFYDLRLAETRSAQAALAREYGIHGFCYYHYWFNGQRILERPFTEVLTSGKPDFPFCLCWANENWTRRWDGNDKQVLLYQAYSAEDDLRHIESLIPAFSDPRYIRIDGKPLFLVYRAELMPEPKRTANIWREATHRAGLGGIYLARVESFNSLMNGVTAPALGFDADVEFPPFSWNLGGAKFRHPLGRVLSTLGLLPDAFRRHKVIDYDLMAAGMQSRKPPEWTRFRCVTPGWDNTARRQDGGYIFHGSTPEKYQRWLARAIRETVRNNDKGKRIVFVNAWNEWAEGNHLEPDLRWGRAYLEATRRALDAAISAAVERDSDGSSFRPAAPSVPASPLRQAYWRLRARLDELGEVIRYTSLPWN